MKRYKKLYMVILILIAVVSTSVCFSYAFFANKNEQHGKLNVVVGDLKYEFESSDLIDNSILIGPGETKEITLTLTSLNSIASKYEIYYNLSNNNNVEVGYTNNPSSGIIGANEVVEINVVIKNKESSEVTVTFGLETGLKNNELVIDGNSLNEINLCEYESGHTWNFAYTGNVQEFTAPCDGIYKIETWGAQGGNDGYLGGYSSGNISLITETNLFVYVGQYGQLDNYSWNGGGFSPNATNNKKYGGGGATDIRLVSGTWSDFDSLKSRIMVAGAGGAATTYHLNTPTLFGVGGGLIGGHINDGYDSSGYGGTQTSGGRGGSILNGNYQGTGGNGSFGKGGNGTSHAWAGGSGYYGGGGGSRNTLTDGGGGGGSSFISGHNGCDAISRESTSSNIIHTGQPNHYSGLVFTETVMIDGDGYNWTNVKSDYVGQPQPDGTTAIGHSGDGYARITYLEQNKIVMFNTQTDNISIDNIIVSPNSEIGILPSPTRENYLFDGWYTDTTYLTKVESNYIVNDNITLYAKWKPITILYDVLTNKPSLYTEYASYSYTSNSIKIDFNTSSSESNGCRIKFNNTIPKGTLHIKGNITVNSNSGTNKAKLTIDLGSSMRSNDLGTFIINSDISKEILIDFDENFEILDNNSYITLAIGRKNTDYYGSLIGNLNISEFYIYN